MNARKGESGETPGSPLTPLQDVIHVRDVTMAWIYWQPAS